MQKEVIKHWPLDWKYGATIDADFHFTRHDWALETVHQLQHYDFVQLFSSYADLSGDAALFVSLLQNYRWLDGKVIHDWLDYAGRYLESKYKSSNPEKLKSIRNKHNKIKELLQLPKKVEALGGLKPDFSPPKDSPPLPTNQPLPTNLYQPIISPQADGLLIQFPASLQEKIKVYIERNRMQNKSKVITNGRKCTLLNELWNSMERCADVDIFAYALEGAISHDACNVGYVNAIVKNRKLKTP